MESSIDTTPEPAGRILVADDSAAVRALLASQLCERGYEIVEAQDGQEAVDLAETTRPDVMLCDIEMPRLDGFGVLQALQASPELAQLPVVFLTGRTGSDDVARGLRLGAYDYLRKPFEEIELIARVQAAMRTRRLQDELRVRNAELELLSATDALTGLYSRRFIAEHLQRAVARVRRHGHALSLLMVDVDRFKAINDTHGHGVGDVVLIAVAERMRARLRAEDLLARWGGEEFLVLLMDTEGDAAAVVGEALREAVKIAPVDHAGHAVHPTVSVGWAEWHASGDSADELMRRADAALYRAKQLGRDRVCGEPAPSPA